MDFAITDSEALVCVSRLETGWRVNERVQGADMGDSRVEPENQDVHAHLTFSGTRPFVRG